MPSFLSMADLAPGTNLLPYLSPDDGCWLPKGLRVFAAEDGPIGVVVEIDERVAPPDEHRLAEVNMIPTLVLRLCGHRCTGPSGVLDQSTARILTPISPPPERHGSDAVAPTNDMVTGSSNLMHLQLANRGEPIGFTQPKTVFVCA